MASLFDDDLNTRSSTSVIPQLNRNMVGGAVGNVLEWYDFAVFGYFAPMIGSQFFPSANRFASLLGAFGVFAVAYVARPFGGIVFGHIGDKLGRKKSLQLSVLLMALATTAVGLLPTYAQVGVFAPMLLVLLRLAQGLSVGGELVGSISFIAEIAPPDGRGLYGSWAFCTATGGILLGSMVATAEHAILSPAALEAWGWRLAFLAGIVAGAFGLWIQYGMAESPVFERAKNDGEIGRNPVAEVVRAMPGQIIYAAALVVLEGAGLYMLFVWWPTYLTDLVHPPIANAQLINMVSLLILTALTPVAGWLSDIVGRKQVLGISSALVAVMAYPLFWSVQSGSLGLMLTAQLIITVLMSGVAGPIPAMLTESFPTRYRFSGIAMGYNISLAIFGGTAPLFCTWLVVTTSDSFSPAYYLSFLAIIGALTAILSRPQFEIESVAQPKKRRSMVIPPPPVFATNP